MVYASAATPVSTLHCYLLAPCPRPGETRAMKLAMEWPLRFNKHQAVARRALYFKALKKIVLTYVQRTLRLGA